MKLGSQTVTNTEELQISGCFCAVSFDRNAQKRDRFIYIKKIVFPFVSLKI